MLIRDADPARDAPACASIYAPYVTDGFASFETTAPDAEAMAGRIASARAYLVAEADGAVVAFAYAGPHRDRAGYRWAVDVSVYVAASHQRSGLGRALYAELFDRLARRGFRIACAGITLPNPASVRLHEAFGFRLVGVYEAIGFKAGAWRDVGWWQCSLGAPRHEAANPPEPT